ncbi:MAG: hypothetical protein WAU44_18205 [Nitrospira sp.]|jgi:hypothetical protein|uniref:hypothetical protein n=1 Tax=Nitrospira sp. ND1 TaxID=1658518 RepID=UPI0009BB1AA7|nr:hypothetical protein [Nitrospira sp. ND1]MBK7420028.1 hypothetical protein [Nitrospira sp.]MBK7486750.1 hypothetical protein [Nitrospira sp.]MBK8378201.1 hypothetical protein [Nitrospira sp.]MBK9999051.1 hypothetical protein [Nitrospira sp.]MBP6199064.1 hypothetical protein [Nitrospira sp.]
MGCWRYSINRCWIGLIMLGICLTWYGVAGAGPLYVYTDAQGQAVLTDNLEQVPAEFRGRVRTMATAEAPPTAAPAPVAAATVSRSPSASGVVENLLNVIAAKVGSRTIKGLTAHQTAVIILAGVCWLALLVPIFMSSNPGIRLLCKFLLVLVGVAALYQVAISGMPSFEAVTGSPQQGSEQAMENVLGKMRSQTEQSYRAQDARTARQLEQIEPPTQ